MKRLAILVVLLTVANWGFGQITSTALGGPWDQTSTWVGGVVPDFNNGAISIVGPVTVSSTFYNALSPLVIDQTTVNTGGTLTINSGAEVHINPGAGADLIVAGTGQIQVNGRLVQLNGATFTTTASNTFFNSNSFYEHRNTGWGTLLTANWNANSTILVNGLTAGSQAGASWAQTVGNFTFDCPNMGAGVANLSGNLTTIAGNFTISNTGTTGRLQFSTNQDATVSVGGDFLIEGSSSFWLTSSGTVSLTVGGTFTVNSTSTASSRNATTGIGTIQINGGDFLVEAGIWNFVSGAGTGNIILNGGNFLATADVVQSTGSGAATISFIGSSTNQSISLDPTLVSAGSIGLVINKSAGQVDLQSDLTIGSFTQSPGNSASLVLAGYVLTVNGIISQSGGLIDATTTSSINISGSGTISANLAFSNPALFDTFTMNRSGVTLSTASSMSITNLNLTAGTVTNSGVLTMEDSGIITIVAGVLTNTPSAAGVYDVSYANTAALNTGNELPTAPSVALRNLSKSAGGTLTLTKNIEINGDLTTTGGTFAQGANFVVLDGNFTSGGTYTSSAGGNFTFTGTGATLSGTVSPSFNGVTVTGTLTPSVSYNVAGNYVVNTGATVNAGSGTVTFNGTTVITNSGTMNLNTVSISGTITAPSTTLGIAGDLTLTGTFNNGSGTILFNGTTNLNDAFVFNNVQVTGSVTSTNQSQTINGNMVNNGSFNIGTGNLLWTGNGTFSGSGATAVADVNVTGTFVSTATGNLTLGDDVLGAGSFDSSGATGQVIFAGGGSNITGTGSRIFRNIQVTGVLNPNAAFSITNNGNLDVTGTIAAGGAVSTLTFAGTNHQVTGTPVAITFEAIAINAGASVTINPSVTFNENISGDGNLTVVGSSTFVGLTISGTGQRIFGNVTVGTGTLTPNSSYSISGNLTVTGTLAAGTSTATFNGTTTISGAGACSFNNLVVSGSLTARLSTEPVVTVIGDFTNSGTFNGSSGSVSLGGNLINNGTFNGGSGSFSFNTSNSATRTITGSNSISFNDVSFFDKGQATDVSNQLTAPASVDVFGALSFGEANTELDADGGGSSILTIRSTADNPVADGRVASITFANSGFGTSNITVQRYMSREGGSNAPSYDNGRIYRYISAPVLNPSVTELQDDIYVTGTFSGAHNGSTTGCTGCTTNASLFYYDSSIPNYVSFPGGNLLLGVGYAAFVRNDLAPPTGGSANAPIVLDFRGTPNTGSVLISSISSNASVWNLVGNPYPSPIAWNNAGTGSANIAAGIAVRDNGSVGSPLVPLTVGGKIATGQAFWVRANVNGAAQLQFNEADKTTPASTIFYRESDQILNQVSFKVFRSDGKYDETFIALNSDAAAGLDTYDIPKKNSTSDLNNDFIDLTTVASSTSFLMNSMPQLLCGQPISLKFYDQLENGTTDLTVGSFVFSVNATGSLKAVKWILHDNYMNADHDFSINSNYQFTIDNAIAASKSIDRFYITPISLQTINPSSAITILTSSICNEEEAVIQFDSQSLLTYDLIVNNNTYPNFIEGNGGLTSIFISSDKLQSGNNAVKLKANSGCDQQLLTSQVTIQKNLPTVVNSVQGFTLCKPGEATLQASSNELNATLRWYATENSAVSLGSGNQFKTSTLSDSATYYVAAVSSAGCEGPRVPVKVAYQYLKKSLEVTEASVCKNTEAVLQVSSDLAGSFRWYESPESMTAISESSNLNIASLESSKAYYVSQVVDGCESERVAVNASVIPFNPVLTATPAEVVCKGQSQTLQVSGAPNGSTYEWLATPTGEVLASGQSSFELSELTENKSFFARVRSAEGCISESVEVRTNVDVEVLIPTFTYSQGSICRDGETSVKLVNQNTAIANYRWYDSESSEHSIATGMELKTESLGQAKSYYVAALSSNGCESSIRKEVPISVIHYSMPVIDTSIPGILKSNYGPGMNQWLLDGKPLTGETDQLLVVKEAGHYEVVSTFKGCQEKSSAVNITMIVTDLKDLHQSVTLYPNPAHHLLHVLVKEFVPVNVQVVNDLGQSIQNIPMKLQEEGWAGEVEVSSWSKGLYFIRISSEGNTVTHKVIVK